MVLDIEQWISTIFYASMVQDPFHTSTMQELLLSYSRSLLWCLIPNNESAQSFMFPWYKTFSTLPQCRNFFTLPQCKIHYGVRYPTTYQHNHPCFHSIGPFPHFHGVKTFPHFHNARIIMVLDTQQRISTIVHTSMVQDPFCICMEQELFYAFTMQESLWCLIPNNGSTQSSMLPWSRTLPTLPWHRNFACLVLGVYYGA